MGPNGSTNPIINRILTKLIIITSGVSAIESHLPNGARVAEKNEEDTVNEKSEGFKKFGLLGERGERQVGVVGEVESGKMLPKVAPSAR